MSGHLAPQNLGNTKPLANRDNTWGEVMEFVDPNWTIHNDRQSVTVGINTRLWQIYGQRMVPTLIRLGREHTAQEAVRAGV